MYVLICLFPNYAFLFVLFLPFSLLYIMPCYSAKDNALVTKVTAPYYSKDNVKHRVPSHLLYFNAETGDLVAVSICFGCFQGPLL